MILEIVSIMVTVFYWSVWIILLVFNNLKICYDYVIYISRCDRPLMLLNFNYNYCYCTTSALRSCHLQQLPYCIYFGCHTLEIFAICGKISTKYSSTRIEWKKILILQKYKKPYIISKWLNNYNYYRKLYSL